MLTARRSMTRNTLFPLEENIRTLSILSTGRAGETVAGSKEACFRKQMGLRNGFKLGVRGQ